MCTYVSNIYLNLIARLGLSSINDEIFYDDIDSLNGRLLGKMWFILENIAILDWISPIFVFHVEQANRIDIDITDICKDAMLRRKTNERLEFDFIATRPCSNLGCERILFAEDVITIVFCMRCLKNVYCSSQCK